MSTLHLSLFWVTLGNYLFWHLKHEGGETLLCNNTTGIVRERVRANRASLPRMNVEVTCPECMNAARMFTYEMLEA